MCATSPGANISILYSSAALYDADKCFSSEPVACAFLEFVSARFVMPMAICIDLEGGREVWGGKGASGEIVRGREVGGGKRSKRGNRRGGEAGEIGREKRKMKNGDGRSGKQEGKGKVERVRVIREGLCSTGMMRFICVCVAD